MRAARVWVLVVGVVGVSAVANAGDPEFLRAPRDPEVALGRRIFLREWAPDDPRARGGDGLGPVFNARSCVACHGIGGPGGGGSNATNVELLTAVALRGEKGKPVDRSSLAALHPGLAESGSILLHRFGLSPAYATWRENAVNYGKRPPRPPVRGPVGFCGWAGETPVAQAPPAPPEPEPEPLFRMVVSKRNAPALFGAGRLDGIPDSAIEAEARRQAGEGKANGRVNRLKDGRVGRFGWKAQVADLGNFVLTACANELGLEVPGRHQAADPLGYGDRTPAGLDLSGGDCNALIAYVRDLPAPAEVPLAFSGPGRVVFERIGCAECHRPSLGGVDGAYTDLLLHDMGPGLSDDGVYYGSEDDSPGVPRRQEWRTPPLWGVAGTGPYLHDGRARTLAAAITAHDGQASTSALAYGNLSTTQKAELLAFLRSLRTPSPAVLGPGRLTRRERALEAAEASGAAWTQARASAGH